MVTTWRLFCTGLSSLGWGKGEKECLSGRRGPFQLSFSGSSELGSTIAEP